MTRERLDPLPRGIRTLSNDESERLKSQVGKSKKFPASPKDCAICDGNQVFRWYSRIPGNENDVVEYDCPCNDQWKLSRYLYSCGIPWGLQVLGKRDIYQQSEAVSVVMDYIDKPEENFKYGMGLFLYGPNGSGKTMLGSLVLKAYAAKGYSICFTTFIELLEGKKSSWSDQDEKDWFARQVTNADILVIDDPGKEHRVSERGIDFINSLLQEVVRYRISNNLPTIITTNLDPADFRKAYGADIGSLLTESTIIQSVPGIDGRRKKFEETQIEMNLGLTRPVVIG